MTPSTMLIVARDRAKPASAHGVGCASGTYNGREVIVTYSAPDKTYDVGTPAQSHAKGQRRHVLGPLTDLMAPASTT